MLDDKQSVYILIVNKRKFIVMKQWEMCELTSSYLDVISPQGWIRHDLNDFEAEPSRLTNAMRWLVTEGWELVSVTDNYTFYFKRLYTA